MARKPPLAERMRPRTLSEFVGQRRLIVRSDLAKVLEEKESFPSIVLWGPPGSGKTTLARIIAESFGGTLFTLSGVNSTVADMREAIASAQEHEGAFILIDEIHRFSRPQQDVILPYLEDGTVTLIGATTENPSFELSTALLSRVQIWRVEPLSEEELVQILRHAIEDPRGLAKKLHASDELLLETARTAGGDARKALTILELAARKGRTLTRETLAAAAQHKALRYDRSGDRHYAMAAALIESMRGSDADATLYWITRMLQSGEDPRFIARRMVIFAAEDVGLADPTALQVAVAAHHAFELVGLPEGIYPLAEAGVYLALAPKSGAIADAVHSADVAVDRAGDLPVPQHLLRPITPMMREFKFGEGYRSPYDEPEHIGTQTRLPDELVGLRLYRPSNIGAEKRLRAKMSSMPERERPEQEELPLIVRGAPPRH